MSEDLHFLTIAEAARRIAARELSPVALTEAMLARIAAVDDVLHGYITVTGTAALSAARIAEAEIAAGRPRGPLHGIPYALKDNYDTAGIRTTASSRLMLDNVPTRDATLHARLQAAGAILLGKLSTWEYGTGLGERQNDLPFPEPRNPWATEHFAGGSSTGAGVAVAAGLTMAALGSDTGGSVRLPAAACGTVGLKPTYGLLSVAGILPNTYSLDYPGPLTWTVPDSALILQAIAGHDPRDPTTVDRPVADFSAGLGRGVKGLRLGVIRRFHEKDIKAAPEVVDAFEAALTVWRQLGAELVECDLPYAVQDYRLCVRLIGQPESLSIHEADLRERHAEMGKALREKLMGSLAVRASDYIRATRWRREIAAASDRVIAGCDAVICAATMLPTPRYDDEAATIEYMSASATSVFNVTGHPALTQCMGFDASGLPLSLQVAGRYFDEPTVLRVAAAYEAATPWRQHRPTVRAKEAALT
ncbi:MAG: amidase [Proteobacteria bacterium]|nr:amidase [Pseudomonadota bacterium]